MYLTIRQLEILAAAAEADTFTAAAIRLGISQPSLSESIRRIETELGVRLFDRTTRSLVLTADGRHAAGIAREAVRDFRLALDSIGHRAQGRRGRITIAALPSIACAVLPAAVREFLSHFPGIEVHVQDVLHERAVSAVADGIADLALTIRPGRLENLHFEEMGSDTLQLVCRGDHPLSSRRQVDWRDLADYPFVALARTSSVRRLTDAAFVNKAVAIEPTYELEQIPSVAALVDAGLGITVLPALTLAMFKGTDLVARPLSKPTMRRHIGTVTLANRPQTEPFTALLGDLRRSFNRVAGRRQGTG
jgi:LysR family carnitine catabolism transcriptional activator